MRSASIIPLSLLFYVHAIQATKIPFKTRSVKRAIAAPGSLHRRANATGSIGSVPIANTHNAEYIANLTLGGQTIPVMLDTGSSDLWVTGTVPGATDLGQSLTLSYAVGQAAGDLNTATLAFGGYTVEDQAFLLVKNTSTFSTDITTQGYQGLVGLGPNVGSLIYKKIDNNSGDNMLNRIFRQNATSQNYITFLLNRLGDNQTFDGQITVSEVVPEFSNITNQEKMSVEKVYGLTDADQHWQILTDKDKGIIGPDGNVISVSSIVPKAPDGQLVAVFDSGFTFPQVSREVSDAIYGRVQGAEWSVANQLWLVPCGQYLNISLNFGGSNFPIHPLDTVSSDFGLTSSTGAPICAGTFQPITTAFSLLGQYDIILGMGFLRNTYTLLDFGTFVEGSSNDQTEPFVQLLPITNAEAARNDFVNVRLNGKDTTNDPAFALLPTSQEQHSPESEKEKHEHEAELVLSRWPEILVGCLAFVAIVVGLIVWRCCCRRNKVPKKNATTILPIRNSTYAPLHDPASSVSLQKMGSGGDPFRGDSNPPNYSTYGSGNGFKSY